MGEKVRVVLIAHSAGGALGQWVLGRGLAKVQGFCMFAAVPGFGSYVLLFFFFVLYTHMLEWIGMWLTRDRWSCYKFWARTAPLNYFYRLFHPRYILATTKQVRDPFFTQSTPMPVVKALERILSPYESMLWPVQALSPIVTGPDVIQSITGWKPRQPKQVAESESSVAPRLFVLAAEFDILCTPPLLRDAAQRYRAAFLESVRLRKLDGLPEQIGHSEDDKSGESNGVKFEVVKGVAHHLQNHVEWEKGAEVVLDWVEEFD